MSYKQLPLADLVFALRFESEGFESLEALITAAAGYDLLTVPPLPRVAVDWLVAAVVYCSNL